MPEQPAFIQRRIGHQRHGIVRHPRQQVELDAAGRQVEEHLIGGALVAVGQGGELPQCDRVEIGDAPAADLAGTATGSNSEYIINPPAANGWTVEIYTVSGNDCSTGNCRRGYGVLDILFEGGH